MSVVSSVLSRVSTRSSPWKVSPRLVSLMDSIFAIGFGLGLRFVVDAVSHHDFKLTGTLVGLWEGIILLHFLKKMPKSTDPYVAYGVRLFVDFLCTESVARLVLVLIWTGMGMVLADITPALWDDVGLNRIWRRFRRDLYTLARMIPTVAFFPPPRTVRFSPSRAPSIIPEEPSILDSQPPSVVTTTAQTGATPIAGPATATTITSSTAPPAREVLRRRVPGYFPTDYSDTDTDLGSIRAGPSAGRTSRRLSVYPQAPEYDDSVSDLSTNNDLDEANLSSGASSASTERAGPSSITFDTAVIPDMEEEELVDEESQLLVDTAAVPVKDEDEHTPRQAPMYLPPTPSDSAIRWRPKLAAVEPDDPLPVRPFSSLPQIPDFLDEPTTEDLEKIQPPPSAPAQPKVEEKPPTPPAKDDLPSRFVIPPVPPVPTNPPPVAPRRTPSPEEEWEILKNEFIVPEATTSDNRQSLPPAYRENEEFDDIYGDEFAPPTSTLDFVDKGKGVDLGAQTSLIDDSIVSPLGAPFNFSFGENAAANPWDARAAVPTLFAAARQAEEERERQRQRAEAEAAGMAEAARQRDEEERVAAAAKEAEEAAERKRKEDEAAAEQERLKEEELKNKKEEERLERKKKEEADELARQQRRLEEEAAEKKKAAEEAERKAEEEAKRKAEEEQWKAKEKQMKEEEKLRKEERRSKKEEEKKEEKARKAEEKKKEEEALAAKMAEEAEAAKIAKEAKAAQRRKEAEEAEERREKARFEKEEKEEKERETAEAAAQRQKDKEEQWKQEEEKQKQEEEKQKKEEVLAKAKADEDAAADTAAAAAVGIALEKELQDQEKQKAKEEADKLKEAQTEAQLQQETPAVTTGTEDPTSPADAQQAHETTPKYKDRDLPPTPTSAEPANGQLADITITPEDPAQADETGEPSAQADDTESVATAASEMPSKVGDRLERLLLGKAQMIDTRDRIQEMKQKFEDPEQDKASIAEQLKTSEKILKKMERKEQRRYTEGVAQHKHLKGDDAADPDNLMFNNLTPSVAVQKIQEKLELLVQPRVEALQLTITVGQIKTGSKMGAKQKPKLLQILSQYGLLKYCIEDAKNGRIMRINVSAEHFREWLLDYRLAVTTANDDDDDNGWQQHL